MDNDELRQITDPVERIRQARALTEQRNADNAETAVIVREAVAELCQTHSKAEVAVLIGVTKGRISQLTKQ